jgi:Rod binding domain-containing protein
MYQVPIPVGNIEPALSAANAAEKARTAHIREVARDFEAIFIRQLFAVMNRTLEQGGMFGQGAGADIYSDLLNEAVADKIAARGGIGLGESIYRRLAVRLEQTEPPGTAAGEN